MERVVVAALLAAVAVAIAWLAQRRRPAPPIRTGWSVPEQLDRADFARPEAPWLAVVFTSTTCDSCPATWEATSALESDQVAAQEVEVGARPDLHRRYRIEAVPAVVIADHAGVVRASHLGPVSGTELRATVDGLRAGPPAPGTEENRPGAREA